MPRSLPRCAGSPWRILVHEWLGTKGENGIRYGRSYDVGNDPGRPAQRAETVRQMCEMRPEAPWPDEDIMTCTVLAGTEFDELVIGRWIHLEKMDTGRWWCNFGGVTINIRVDRDGRPKHVDVYGPGDYAEPEKGCTYEVNWSAGD